MFIVALFVSGCDYHQKITKDVFNQACMTGAKPIISVADFDGNGTVEQIDLDELNDIIQGNLYLTLYDRNVDGKIDQLDLQVAQTDLGMTSTTLDQQLASLSKATWFLQNQSDRGQLYQMGFHKSVDSIAGHGEHWFNDKGDKLTEEGGDIVFEEAIGFNIPYASSRVWALFWGIKADLVFADGANDHPTPGGAWETQQVVAFSGSPPNFTENETEIWHTHAGLCSAPQERKGEITDHFIQHDTYQQCQQRDSVARNLGQKNGWTNIWMLHAWIFVPNPNGIFANTHPCIDPDSPSEDELNSTNNVPEFFQHHH